MWIIRLLKVQTTDVQEHRQGFTSKMIAVRLLLVVIFWTPQTVSQVSIQILTKRGSSVVRWRTKASEYLYRGVDKSL